MTTTAVAAGAEKGDATRTQRYYLLLRNRSNFAPFRTRMRCIITVRFEQSQIFSISSAPIHRQSHKLDFTVRSFARSFFVVLGARILSPPPTQEEKR